LLARHPEHSSLAPVIRYWNNGQQEVDFVVQQGQDLLAIEVKSGLASRPVPGLEAFLKLTPAARPIRLGTGGMPLELWFGA
jgi:predicted AAA+ superfamily ATPase